MGNNLKVLKAEQQIHISKVLRTVERFAAEAEILKK